MDVLEWELNCSQCGKKIGIASIFQVGVSHIANIKMCCIECLPARLNQLEQEGYNKEEIAKFREWINEVNNET